MERTEKITIDSENYQITEMPATKRSIIGLELKQIVTGASSGVKGLDEDIDYSKMIAGILDRVEPEKGAYLLRDIIMNGIRFPVMEKVQDYDVHFTEFYDHQIDLVSAIMELNFGKSITRIKKKLETTGLLTLISLKLKEKEKTQDSAKQTP